MVRVARPAGLCLSLDMDTLNETDLRLLRRHLSRYKQLENSEVEPSSPNEKHFIAVFVDGQENPITQHEIAYSRFKATNSTAEVVDAAKDLENHENNDDGNTHQELMIDQLDSVLIESRAEPENFSLASNIRNYYQSKQVSKDDITANALVWLNFLTESSISKALERWSASTFNNLSNEYTKIIDGAFAEGLKSGADYVSPTIHRLLDGHTLPEAFRRGRDALENDTAIQEVYGTLEALLSDMSSVVGLPIVQFGKEKAEAFKEAFAFVGVDEKRFADFFSYNSVEVISSAIPALALMFSWNSDDASRFAKTVGALGVSTAYAGNPLGTVVVLVGLARSFQKARTSNQSTKDWAKSLGSGGIMSTVVIVSMSVVGPSIWVFLISILITINLMKARGFDVSWKKVGNLLFEYIKGKKAAKI